MEFVTTKTKDTVIIRPAKITDAAEIVKCINEISGETDFLTFGPGEFGMSIEQEERYLERISKQNNAIYVVAEINGKIIGTLSFSGGTRPRTAHAGEFSVCIKKKYWGNGIGTELVKYLIDWCKQSGVIRKINLRVRIDNYSAIRVYQKLGFVESGIISREIQMDGRFYDVLCMGYHID